MLVVARTTGDEDMVEFWEYVCDALNILKHDGMSDEEDGTEKITTEDGVKTSRDVRLVSILWFRHESFRTLFELVDQTKGLEEMIFNQAGRASIPRKRVAIVNNRSPPPGLIVAVFRPGYLGQLAEHEVDELRLVESDFVVHDAEEFDLE